VRIPGAQRPALVGATIQHRKVLAADVEDADLPAVHVDDLAFAWWNLVDRGDDVLHAATRLGSL
jgi:hypothetical protein